MFTVINVYIVITIVIIDKAVIFGA